VKENRTDIARRFSVDQLVALLLLPMILLILGVLYLLVVPLQGRPFLFSAERMRGPKDVFKQHKIRTMHPIDRVVEQSVMGGDLEHRVTPIGAFLRKTRLDELPQIFNILQGDMVFIGPRPPLRKYIESDQDYARSLSKVRPGVTGLATVLLHAREERILSKCKNAAETDRAYRRHCIPLKIRMDELYRRKKSRRLKLFILWRTVSGLAISDASKRLCQTLWAAVLRKVSLVSIASEDRMSHVSTSARQE
jgi:lipopolysaccharide/colanic/teichoic acid biosynthesis glycosyltransferase